MHGSPVVAGKIIFSNQNVSINGKQVNATLTPIQLFELFFILHQSLRCAFMSTLLFRKLKSQCQGLVKLKSVLIIIYVNIGNDMVNNK